MLRTRRFTAQYRTVDDPMGVLGTTDLQAMIGKALAWSGGGQPLHKNPRDRTRDDAVKGSSYVLNVFRERDSHFFGEIIRYTQGAKIPLIVTSSGESIFDLKKYSTPDGEQLIKGFLYFCVYKNHIVLAEDDLSTKSLEEYLNWLIQEKTKISVRDSHFQIVRSRTDSPFRLKQVNQIRIDGRLQFEDMQKDLDLGEDVRKLKLDRLSIIEVLKAATFESAALEDLLLSADAEVILTVKLKDKRKNKIVDARLIDRLTRHMPDGVVTLFGPQGKEVSGHMESLGKQFDIDADDDFVDPSAMQKELFRAMEEMQSNGYLS